MRRNRLTALVATLIVPLAGCVSKSEHQALEAQLEECRQDKAAAQQAAEFCERRYAKEIERWDDIQAVMEEALPQTIQKFEAERDEVLQLIPEEVREQVDEYLTGFSRAVAQGFDTLHDQNEQILTELEVYKASLSEVGVRTQSIDETVTSKLQEANAARRQVGGQVSSATAAIVDEIQEFDRSYISDKASPDRLKLNRNQRETIALFHDGLVRRLIDLREAVELSEEPAESTEPAEGDSTSAGD